MRYAWADPNGDGAVDQQWQFEYDKSGLLVVQRLDGNGDGTYERITQYTYDSRQRPLTITIDADANGTLDEISTIEYDDIVRTARANIDRKADGILDIIVTTHFDALGQVVRIDRDSNADGEPDWITLVEWAHRLRVREEVRHRSGRLDSVRTFGYNDRGLPTITETDMAGDGTIDILEEMVWDDLQRLVRVTQSRHRVATFSQSLSFLEDGRLSEVKTHDMSTGTESMRRFEYECPP